MTLFLLGTLLSGDLAHADQMNWSAGTAHVLPGGRKEIGLFGPLRMGLENGRELQVHPGWFFVSPHAAIKQDIFELASWNVGVRQSVSYPTLLLRGLARSGIGGMLAADAAVPHIIASDTQLLFTKSASKDYDLTFWGELSLAVGIGENDWPTIDSPLGYYQTAVYQNIFGLNAGMRVTGRVFGQMHFKTDLSAALIPLAGTPWSDSDSEASGIPDATGTWTLTESTSLLYRFNEGVQAQAGFIFRYGDYPYGRNWHLLPTIDVVFGW